ncbi:MAG: hypothetical protein E7641_04795 [Ruminococcaceae bacterium]|nr:hypothetical protein [Oscillospiraceae bacterium]
MNTNFKKLSFDELCEKLCEEKRTLIVFHARPDADAVGSAFALRALLWQMNIPAICACTDEIPERLSFLTEEAQGSVLLDDTLLLGHERVISVDAASPSQLGSLFDRLHKDIDIMIDHHSEGKVYADNYVRPEAAATGEIILDIAKYLLDKGRIGYISEEIYCCIYAAISSDTGCFRYSNVTPNTHACGAELVASGIDTAQINHRLFECKSLKQIKAEGEAARRLETFSGGRVASVKFPYSAKFSMSLLDEHLETVIDVPRSIIGVEVAVAVKQLEDKGVFRVSMRSNSDFDVSAVCACFGGGGHKKAAGCTVEARTIDDAEKMILGEVFKRLQ